MSFYRCRSVLLFIYLSGAIFCDTFNAYKCLQNRSWNEFLSSIICTITNLLTILKLIFEFHVQWMKWMKREKMERGKQKYLLDMFQSILYKHKPKIYCSENFLLLPLCFLFSIFFFFFSHNISHIELNRNMFIVQFDDMKIVYEFSIELNVDIIRLTKMIELAECEYTIYLVILIFSFYHFLFGTILLMFCCVNGVDFGCCYYFQICLYSKPIFLGWKIGSRKAIIENSILIRYV